VNKVVGDHFKRDLCIAECFIAILGTKPYHDRLAADKAGQWKNNIDQFEDVRSFAEFIRQALKITRGITDRPQPADKSAHGTAHNDIDRDIFFFQHLDDANVCQPESSTSA